MHPYKSHKSKENIEILIEIGEYKLQMSIPRQTKVSSLLTIVKNYQQLHDKYAPMDSHFIGMASTDNNPVIDYLLTQNQVDFTRFTKNKLRLRALYSIDKYINKLTISQFQFLKCLGKGVIGQVYLVRNKVTGYLFAMKRIRKSSIHDYKSWEGIIRQKKILTLLPPNNHTVTFHGSFQSQNYFNFLLDYYPGGQLFLHLVNKSQNLTEQQVKIYFCQVLLAMQFLHKKKILYRDLKPQNILVDVKGHLRITDFGMSKCGFQQENIADTFCGSQQYMAPEVMGNKNYNFSADFYSIGAILYEFLTGLPPYYNQQDSQQKLQHMNNMDLDLSMVQNPHLRQLLQNLLHPIPEQRICNYNQIKNNQWLKDVNWKEIENKKNTIKFAPDIYKCYIGEEFLELQEQVERMNGIENQDFQPIFQGLFNFVKQSSQTVVLGVRTSTVSQKCYLQQMNQNKNLVKDHFANKRKTTGFIKQKSKITTKHKQNYSIQLFQKDDSSNSSHTNSTSNSNVTNLPYDPKTTRNNDLKNKQNILNFKKSTKKLNTVNDTLGKITKNPSQKKLLTKQPSQSNLLKQKLIQRTQKQKCQKIILKNPSTIRLVPQKNAMLQEKQRQHILIRNNNPSKFFINSGKQNQFASRSELQSQNHYTSINCRQASSSKRLNTRISENFTSIQQNPTKNVLKQKTTRSNMKSKTKDKSKSKDRLHISSRTKQNYPNNSGSTFMIKQKVKLPACTYKIKLI